MRLMGKLLDNRKTCLLYFMRMDLKQLKSLSVETVSGKKLGHVFDLVFEIDGQLVVQYLVRTHALGGRVYMIGRDQIVRFSAKKILVEDRVFDVDSREEVARRTVASPQSVAMSTGVGESET